MVTKTKKKKVVDQITDSVTAVPVKEKITWPKVTVGTHLTVTEYEDGRTTLVWDDEQLLKEVREATK